MIKMQMWEDTHSSFLEGLVRTRALMFMNDERYLKKLRFDYDRAIKDQELFGQVWGEFGTDVFQLIAKACGESWDAEDEEKKEAAVNQRDNDNLVATREESACRGQHQLQGEPEESLSLLEEEQSSESGKSGESGTQETEEKEEEMCRVRRKGFYRSAGGSE